MSDVITTTILEVYMSTINWNVSTIWSVNMLHVRNSILNNNIKRKEKETLTWLMLEGNRDGESGSQFFGCQQGLPQVLIWDH